MNVAREEGGRGGRGREGREGERVRREGGWVGRREGRKEGGGEREVMCTEPFAL